MRLVPETTVPGFNRLTFLDAWSEWDNKPGNQEIKERYVEQVQSLAAATELTLPQVTGLLQAWRRAGRSRFFSLEALLAGVRVSEITPKSPRPLYQGGETPSE